MTDRIDPVRRRAYPAPVARVERAVRRDPEDREDDEPPPRRPKPPRRPPAPGDGRPHVDVRA